MKTCVSLHIEGIVQGVGFRPFVYREAKKHLIKGTVKNSLDGVIVEAEGEENNVDDFVMALSDEAPQASDVKQIEIKEIPLRNFSDFQILESEDFEQGDRTLVSPDLGICDDCLRELFDKNDRRYHYPFINCTNCGPRFTIIEDLPYDREKTSMSDFEMCYECKAEFRDPDNRRFHAQPDACFECGPKLFLNTFNKTDETAGQGMSDTSVTDAQKVSDMIINACSDMLLDGKILAVKGLGGYHLVCDAKNEVALSNLRERKHRDNKAFAVTLKNVEVAKKYCYVSEEEESILKSCERPIVILKKRADFDLPHALSGDLPELGVMLPGTPVQALLLDAFEKKSGDLDAMLVMTSGNLHDEPIVIDDEEAKIKFEGVADAILSNNRKILTRFDDSVLRVLDFGEGQTAVQMIRRARGYAPKPISVTTSHEGDLFATGPEQKNTFCFLKKGKAFVSQHIGDVENATSQDAWFEAKSRFEQLFEIPKNCDIVCDKHPEYLTSKWAFAEATKQENARKFDEVYHHHAHIVSAMAENGVSEPVIGFSFDGTGYGADGCIWGGEVLLCNTETFERVANFAYFPLPGGASAIKHPLKCAYGIAYACDLLEDAPEICERLGEETSVCQSMIDENINTPYTSSLGRIFDAVSAYLGICEKPTYEGEAATMLEACMANEPMSDTSEDSNVEERYAFEILKNSATEHSTALDTSMFVIDERNVFSAIVQDKQQGVSESIIAKRFHDAITRLVVTVSQITYQIYGIKKVALAGGVWMNRYLIEHTVVALTNAGFDVVLNRELPPNDGGVSFGQAIISANRKLAKGKEEQ